MKTLFCVFIMLTIAPISAAIGLISFDPKSWGGSFTVQNILAIAFFGIITVPLLVTYLPSLVLTPIIMEKISNYHLFYSLTLWKFIAISIFVGIIGGILILLPCIIMAFSGPTKLIMNWIWAGVISGGVSFTIISLLYRRMGS